MLVRHWVLAVVMLLHENLVGLILEHFYVLSLVLVQFHLLFQDLAGLRWPLAAALGPS